MLLCMIVVFISLVDAEISLMLSAVNFGVVFVVAVAVVVSCCFFARCGGSW